jgi:hypothetical protein
MNGRKSRANDFSASGGRKVDERKITAMTEIITDVLAVILLPGGLLALVRYARRDVFAGPGIGHDPRMEPEALHLAGLRRRRR